VAGSGGPSSRWVEPQFLFADRDAHGRLVGRDLLRPERLEPGLLLDSAEQERPLVDPQRQWDFRVPLQGPSRHAKVLLSLPFFFGRVHYPLGRPTLEPVAGDAIE